MHLLTFNEVDVHKKLKALDFDLHQILTSQVELHDNLIPKIPGRDVQVCAIEQMPVKLSLQEKSGQRRLIHDLAHIEMQAMELGLRTLVEFYDQTPALFKEQLVDLIKDEARHLEMLITSLNELGGHWGEYPVHLSLWNAVSSEDNLLERILIVHRYLEGSGLDAGDKILNRLYGVGERDLLKTVKVIVDEEVGHVQFGSYWYKTLCEKQKLNPDQHFINQMQMLKDKLPKRIMKLNYEKRKQAGFSNVEIEYLQNLK